MKQKKTKRKSPKIITVLCGHHTVRIRASDYSRLKKRYGGNTITVKRAHKKLWAYIKTETGAAVPVGRLILGLDVGATAKVQYKDENPLNLDKANLYTVEHADIMKGRRKQKKTSSKYKGVYFDRTARKWKAQISPGKRKNLHLGYFTLEDDAAKAYNTAALAHFGEHAYLNIIPTDTLK